MPSAAMVDDIADEESPFADKLPRLDAWRARIAALYAGRAEDAITRVLLAGGHAVRPARRRISWP